MIRKTILAAAVIAVMMPLYAQKGLTGFPFTSESLHYSVNWPSGLSLGDAHLSAAHSGSAWNFDFTIDASVPGFGVKDSYQAQATDDAFCTVSFTKDIVHGAKKGHETETVDRGKGTVKRATAGGGSSEVQVPDCTRDALSFLFFARRELGQGRVPQAQQILLGGLYQARLEYAGAEVIQVNDKPVQSDKVICHIKGPSSDIQFDAYFDRDAARTPLAIRVPLSMGKFSLELVR